MGASGWLYFVPWQADVGRALRVLRRAVFERREYVDPDETARGLLASEGANRLSESVRLALRERAQRGAPRSIEELLVRAADAGTHSVLDVLEVADTSDLLVSAPLSHWQLTNVFGTAMPTRQQVETSHHDLMNVRPPWCGTHVTIYEDQEPVEICFSGFSGR